MPVNEFKENKAEVTPVQDSSRLEQSNFSLDTVLSGMKEFSAGADSGSAETPPDSKEAVREYGLKECCDAAKNVFTRETLSEWGKMSSEQRGQKIQEYSKSLAESLHIELKGIVYEKMSGNINGYVNGDGYIHLNKDFLNRPDRFMPLIETVAHESRRQMQYEAVKNPEKFDVDKAEIKKWAEGLEKYSDPSKDPYELYNNPSESDARCFGESVAKELAKELTAGGPLNKKMMETLDAVKPSSPGKAESKAFPSFGSYCTCGNRCGDHCFQTCSSNCRTRGR